MSLATPSFSHEFNPGGIQFGRGCIDSLEETLENKELDSALVVTGQNVGANELVMDPVTDGLGSRLAGVFDRTSPEKRIETAFDGVDEIRDVDADVLVAVGGGSSLDTATTMCILDGKDATLEDVLTEFRETDAIAIPENVEPLLPVIAVPSTFAGADLSVAAGTTLPPADGEAERRAFVFLDDGLMPLTVFYDPNLFETTPMTALTGSAMNGFNKGIEMVYSQYANPITDATAVRGLKYLRSSYPQLVESDDPEVMERAVLGILLVQYGLSVPEAYKINIIHACGHAVRNTFGIQQGIAHAILTPHVLRLMFDEVDGRRDALAEALVLEDDVEDEATAVIDAVTEIRDGLGLPSRFRDVEGTTEEKLPRVAELTHEDHFFRLGPAGFDPSLEAVEQTLRDAW